MVLVASGFISCFKLTLFLIINQKCIGEKGRLLDKNENLHIAFEGFLHFLPYLVLPFSAPFVLFFALLILFFLCRFLIIVDFVGLYFAYVLLVVVLHMWTLGTFERDLFRYYTTYLKLLAGDMDALFEYGRGIEFALPAYYLVLGHIFGQVDMLHFAFLNSITVGFLLLLWFEMYGVNEAGTKEVTLCSFLLFLFFDYWEPIWAIRQIYSSIFILFALSQKRTLPMLFFVAISSFFHISGLVFFVILYIIRHHNKLGITLVFLISIFMLQGSFLTFLVSHIPFIPDSIASKLNFYENIHDHGTTKATISWRTIAYICVLIFFAFLNRKYISNYWKNIIILYGIILICAATVDATMFGRIGNFYLFIIMGMLFFVVLHRHSVLLYIFCILLYLDKIRVFISSVFFLDLDRMQHTKVQGAIYHY